MSDSTEPINVPGPAATPPARAISAPFPRLAGSSVTDDRDEFERRLRDAKLAALAEFAAGAGHEINNPVATIVGRAQLLIAAETDPGRRSGLATIAAQALRIRDMIGDLMLFARPPAPEPAWIDLAAIAREVVEPFGDRARDSGVSLALRAETEVFTLVDPTHAAVALTELVENALNAASRGGHVTVETAQPDGTPTLCVRDDGPGFTDVDREHAFDPFYSGRQAGRGLGFGLPKAWRIVTLAGGTIHIDSRPGETTATIRLPRPSPGEGSAPADPPSDH